MKSHFSKEILHKTLKSLEAELVAVVGRGRKLWTFTEVTKTRKRLSLKLLTTYGLNRNVNSSGLVETVLTLEDLFLE